MLSGNSVDHLLVTLGAMTAGIPVAPVSVAYSLQSRDHARIKAITELIRPGAVFAEDADRFGPALDALPAVAAIVSRQSRPGAEPLADLLDTEPGPAVHEALRALGRRRGGQDPVHLRVDGRPQGRHQHAPDAGVQSADDPAGVAVPRQPSAR